MTVFPLYWRMWHDRPTSLPPPRHRNISSSAGSTGSSSAGDMAASFRLVAMLLEQDAEPHKGKETGEERRRDGERLSSDVRLFSLVRMSNNGDIEKIHVSSIAKRAKTSAGR